MRAVTALPFLQTGWHHIRFSRAGLLQVFRNPSEWKSAVMVALVVFVASLALAPLLTTDQRTLAAEINSKTLRAAAAINTAAQ